MTGQGANRVMLEIAGAQLEAALAQGDVGGVMERAAEMEGLVRRLGPAALDDPSLRPALRSAAGLVARVLERLADEQEATLAARMRDRRVQAAYGARL